MINLLRGEFYKLFRSKSLYICCIVTVAFVLFMYGMFTLADKTQQGEIENGSYGIVVSESEEIAETVTVWDELNIPSIVQMLFYSIGSIMVAIFTSIFVFGEYANGAIKNVVGKGYGRGAVLASKYISTVVGAIIIETIILLSVLLCEGLILGADRLDSDILLKLCGYTGMQFLLGVAFTGIIVMISQICRNLGAGIAISICLITFNNFITAGLNAILAYFKINVNVCDYWILDLISNCPVTDMDKSFLIRAITCAVIWFALAFGVGSVHFRKVDVK